MKRVIDVCFPLREGDEGRIIYVLSLSRETKRTRSGLVVRDTYLLQGLWL